MRRLNHKLAKPILRKMDLENEDLTSIIPKLQSLKQCDTQLKTDAVNETDRNPRNKSLPIIQLIYDKGGNTTQLRKDSFFNGGAETGQ